MGLERPSGLAGWLDALKACTDVDVLWTGLSRGDDGDARENDDAVTSTGTLDVLNVGLMGTPGMDGDVAVVVVAGGTDVDDAGDWTDVARLLRASGDMVIPEQRRRDKSPIESWRSLRRSRSAWLSSTVVLDSCRPIHGKCHLSYLFYVLTQLFIFVSLWIMVQCFNRLETNWIDGNN